MERKRKISGKKHSLTEHEYKIYRKIHTSDDPVKAEQGKIGREKASYVERRTKGKTETKRMLRNIPGDVLALDEEFFFDENDFISHTSMIHLQKRGRWSGTDPRRGPQ